MNKKTMYIVGGIALAYLLYYAYSKKKGTPTTSADKSASTKTPVSYKNDDEKFKAVFAEIQNSGAKTKEEAEAILKKMGVTQAEVDAYMKKSMETALQGLAKVGVPSKTNFGFGGFTGDIL